MSASSPEPRRGRRYLTRGLVLAGLVLIVDQATKLWVLHLLRLPYRFKRMVELTPFFDLTYTENRGVSFGLFAGGMSSRIILSVLSLVVSIFLVRWLMRITRPVTAMGAGLILGGAIGNLIDRVFYGFVVDFLDFSGLGFPYIFNVADAGINIGLALLLFDALWLERRELKQRQGG
jgi:signal peptidase II